MAFVVPAEIGHAPYARPVLDYLVAHFAKVQVVAIEDKIFPELSEDCWLLYADDYGLSTDHILLSPMTRFGYMAKPPSLHVQVGVSDWRQWNSRLRPFLLSSDIRALYRNVADRRDSVRLGNIAKVGIGYVTGDNKFFHMRPSEARQLDVPEAMLQPTVRNGKMLTGRAITANKVQAWRRRDEPNFLLRLDARSDLPKGVRRYLNSAAGQKARTAYKCRNRKPWYVVPDVAVPDAFLSYMSGDGLALVTNRAKCSGTNSVHMVRLNGAMNTTELVATWRQPFTQLSCELEGHPLGGGMLKAEPREAGRVVLSRKPIKSKADKALVREGISTMRRWRHCG